MQFIKYKLSDIHCVDTGLLNRCNLSCPLCPYILKDIKNTQKYNCIDIDKFINFLERLPNVEVIILEGNYCEPTLHPKFLKLLKYLKTRNLSIRLSTNGATHNDDFWYEVGGLLKKDDVVRLPIEGPTQEIHEKYRVGSKIENVLRHHKVMRSNPDFKATTVLQNVVFQFNKQYQDEMKKIFMEEGFTFISFIKCYPTSISNQTEFNALPEIKKYMDTYEKTLKVTPHIPILCDSFFRKEIYVNHRNEIQICGSLDEDNIDNFEKPKIDDPDEIIEKFISKMWNERNPKNKDSIKNMNSTCKGCCNYFCYTLGEKYPDYLISRDGRVTEMNYFTKELQNEEFNAGHRIIRKNTNLV